MDCKKTATVSRPADEREGNITHCPRHKKSRKRKNENNCKNGQTRCLSNPQINKLPNEILCQIFSYLNIKDRLIIEKVCRRWREVGFNSWNDICVLNPMMMMSVIKKKKLTLSKLIEVLERCNLSLRKLEIDGSCLWINRFPEEICSYCPNLKSITFRGMHFSITAEDALVMVNGWKNLTDIALPCTDISEECLYLFFTSYNIEHLELSTKWIVGDTLCLLQDCLKSILLNRCRRITSDNLKRIANLHRIRNLQLSGCELVNVSTLISIVKSLQASLVELKLGGNFHRSDDGQTFSVIASYCQNIQVLYLANNNAINDDVVSVISKTCLQLRVLNISTNRVTNDSLRSLSVLPRLQQLFVNANDLISKDGIRCISESQSLERIDLQWSRLIENEDVIYLATNCRTLKVINVRQCWKTTENLMEELLSQLPREEGYTLDVITTDFVISRIVYESSEMVVHPICSDQLDQI